MRRGWHNAPDDVLWTEIWVPSGKGTSGWNNEQGHPRVIFAVPFSSMPGRGSAHSMLCVSPSGQLPAYLHYFLSALCIPQLASRQKNNKNKATFPSTSYFFYILGRAHVSVAHSHCPFLCAIAHVSVERGCETWVAQCA